MFVNREKPLQKLEALSDREENSLALIYGRRRIGKTFLLKNTWNQTPVFFFTASNVSPALNRKSLIREAESWVGHSLNPEDYPSWRMVFRELLNARSDEPVILILDEFQFFASKGDVSEVTSELNAVWEGHLSREAGLLLVLCGSAVRTLRALDQGGAPLYGRLDWTCKLEPFDYLDAAKMVPSYSPVDCIRTYAAFGGIPMYLNAVDSEKSLEKNIIRHLLAPDGFVRTQLETALEQEQGLRRITQYRSILARVGHGRHTIGEIASSLDRPVDQGLRRMLEQLIKLNFLQRGRNFDSHSNEPYRYRLADPAFRFFYGMVLSNESAIEHTGADRVWKERLADQIWPTYVGKEIFEEVVKQAYLRFQGVRNLPPVEEWGRWEGLDRNRESIEFDAVCRLLNGAMMTGSMKFRSRPIGAEVFVNHVNDLRKLQNSGYQWAHEALEKDSVFLFVSRSGFRSSFSDVRNEYSERRVLTWDLSDLFEEKG